MDLKTKSEKCRSSYWSQSIFLKEYDVALKNSYEKVSQIVASLRDIDVKEGGSKRYVKF
jgi:hypothetical protein